MRFLAKLFVTRERLWELEKENLRLKAEAKYRTLLLEDYKAAHNNMLKILDAQRNSEDTTELLVVKAPGYEDYEAEKVVETGVQNGKYK